MESRGQKMLRLALANNKNNYSTCEDSLDNDCKRQQTTISLSEALDPEISVPVSSLQSDESTETLLHYSDDSDTNPTYVPNSNEEQRDFLNVKHRNKTNLIQEKQLESTVVGNEDISKLKEKKKGRKIREERKRKRNCGEEYYTDKGKLVKKRRMKPLKMCRAKCGEKISEVDRFAIFNEYWQMGDYNRRVAYAASLMDITDKASSRSRTGEKIRQKTYKYSLSVKGVRVSVCRNCFLNTLDESDNFVKHVGLKKRQSTCGIVILDRHSCRAPSNKLPGEKILEIQNHIGSFPRYESHYTRRSNDKKYLASHLTISAMYSLYCEKVQNPASLTIYKEEFHKLKLSFKKSKVDTCYTCDVFEIKIEMLKNDSEKNAVIKERDFHHNAAQKAYDEKKKDTDLSKHTESMKCFTFDLQQCLPTPALQTSVAFYKRQLWTYNLTIHDNGTGHATHYIWHEAMSGRGANQIASCLYKHISNFSPNVKHVVFYSDTCGGQNKNSHVATMFLALLGSNTTNIETIDHKFMIPGHSHLEVDRDHAIIEKKKKKTSIQIFHPYDWGQLIRSSSINFSVIEMQQDDFIDFASLLKQNRPFILRKEDVLKNAFKWHDVQWLQYNNSQFGIINYKQSLSESELFKQFSLKRRGNHEIKFQVITSEPVPISSEKKKDLLALLPFIPSIFHSFYENLISLDIKDIDPDLVEYDADAELAM